VALLYIAALLLEPPESLKVHHRTLRACSRQIESAAAASSGSLRGRLLRGTPWTSTEQGPGWGGAEAPASGGHAVRVNGNASALYTPIPLEISKIPMQ